MYHEDDFAQVTGDLKMALGHLLAVGNDDGASLSRCEDIRKLG